MLNVGNVRRLTSPEESQRPHQAAATVVDLPALPTTWDGPGILPTHAAGTKAVSNQDPPLRGTIYAGFVSYCSLRVAILVVGALLFACILAGTSAARGHRSWITHRWMGLEIPSVESDGPPEERAPVAGLAGDTHARPPGGGNSLRGIQLRFAIAPGRPSAETGVAVAEVHRYPTQFGVLRGIRGAADIFAIRATCERDDGTIIPIVERVGGGDDNGGNGDGTTTYALRRMDGKAETDNDTGVGVLIILSPHGGDLGAGGAVCVISCSVL